MIGPETARFLDEKALESFKRQADLEESIWRSLPLFSGGLIAAGADLVLASLPPKLDRPAPPPLRIIRDGAWLTKTSTAPQVRDKI